jgi:cyclopropane fatty-acyl-phospholipid synthase-like methyltransferase
MNAPVNPNKALWEKGDFTRIAECTRESGEALVQRLGISSGLKVLDLGCGDGPTAIPAAKLGAEVLGIDIASNLVAAGDQRAKDLGLANCRFQEGDATNLRQVQENAFDLVVSIFGAMFAPKPQAGSLCYFTPSRVTTGLLTDGSRMTSSHRATLRRAM